MAKLPEGVWGIEVWGWYDGIAYYEDKNTGERYSKIAHIPIAKDELCRYGKIYKVIYNENEIDFNFTILSEIPDEDPEDTSRTEDGEEPNGSGAMQPTVLTTDA